MHYNPGEPKPIENTKAGPHSGEAPPVHEPSQSNHHAAASDNVAEGEVKEIPAALDDALADENQPVYNLQDAGYYRGEPGRFLNFYERSKYLNEREQDELEAA